MIEDQECARRSPAAIPRSSCRGGFRVNPSVTGGSLEQQGGTVTSATISLGGLIDVSAGGQTFDAMIAAASSVVSSGGLLSGGLVSGAGVLQVLAGGTANNVPVVDSQYFRRSAWWASAARRVESR
jgi:hypothetical protein